MALDETDGDIVQIVKDQDGRVKENIQQKGHSTQPTKISRCYLVKEDTGHPLMVRWCTYFHHLSGKVYKVQHSTTKQQHCYVWIFFGVYLVQ